MTLFFGIAALLVILWFLKLFSTADIHKFATTIRSPLGDQSKPAIVEENSTSPGHDLS